MTVGHAYRHPTGDYAKGQIKRGTFFIQSVPFVAGLCAQSYHKAKLLLIKKKKKRN